MAVNTQLRGPFKIQVNLGHKHLRIVQMLNNAFETIWNEPFDLTNPDPMLQRVAEECERQTKIHIHGHGIWYTRHTILHDGTINVNICPTVEHDMIFYEIVKFHNLQWHYLVWNIGVCVMIKKVKKNGWIMNIVVTYFIWVTKVISSPLSLTIRIYSGICRWLKGSKSERILFCNKWLRIKMKIS